MIKHIERIAHHNYKMCMSPALKKFIIHLKELKNAMLYTRISEMEKRIVGKGKWDLNSL